MGDPKVCSMLPNIPCKTTASLEKLVCLPLTLLWARASTEIAVHSEASTATSEDISAYWCCSAESIITFKVPKRSSVRTWEKRMHCEGVKPAEQQ